MILQPKDFTAFFTAVHGYDPFPWQTRLVSRVLEEGWPETLAIPTGCGKTAILDVGIFILALQASLKQRHGCRRIALVVDRRIVVDQATARAKHIAQSLQNLADPIVREVASALRSLAGQSPSQGERPPLQVATLRGGLYLDEYWASSPLQPVILCSTVDQVGSRLLHRGYGLTSRSQPIHAGLLCNDTLIVLDEAHCSRPFLQTLRYISQLREVAEKPITLPFHVLAMTATPRDRAKVFGLGREDEENPEIKQRLAASKRGRLILTKGKDAEFAEECRKAIEELLKESGPSDPRSAYGSMQSDSDVQDKRRSEEHPRALQPVRTILVVVNRVRTARKIFEKLEPLTKIGGKPEIETVLLTGRSRPWDRENLLRKYSFRLMAGRSPRNPEGTRPLVVVATQCVEVGADLDVDALVTEACPLDSLRQRLGRLDRLGQRGWSPVRILCRKELEPKMSKEDASSDAELPEDIIYGKALARTWQWLKRRAKTGSDDEIELGSSGLEMPPDSIDDYLAPTEDAPVMFPAYCDLWVQTGPMPEESPDPSWFLHGTTDAVPDVQLVWRADLAAEQEDSWVDTVALCPPMAEEMMPVPLHEVSNWLSSENPVDEDGGDLAKGSGTKREKKVWEEQRIRSHVLRWRGPEESEVVDGPDKIRPGDVIILPCACGGCDQFGWNPQSAEPVEDISLAVLAGSQRRAVLRATPEFCEEDYWGSVRHVWNELANLDPEKWPDNLEEACKTALAASMNADEPLRSIIDTMRRDERFSVEPHPAGKGIVLLSRHRIRLQSAMDDDTSVLGEAPVSLLEHMRQVEGIATRFASKAGLPESLVNDVALAARFHDVGKADPRFQAWIAGGDFIAASRAGLLAKSDRLHSTPRARQRARRLSGYPEGYRHEMLSVRMLESAPSLMESARDRDLVLHLIASHHGHCRPFSPFVTDERPIDVTWDYQGTVLHASSDTQMERLDSGVAERFWNLVRRYGWWALSYLEAILKLADWKASRGLGSEAGTDE